MSLGRKWRKLFEQEKPFRFLFGRILSKSGLCRLFTIKTHGYLLRFHPATLSEEIWCSPESRYPDINFIRTYLKAGDTYFDVGANIGNLLIPASNAVGETGRVVAFEPHPRVYSYLSDNLRLNKVRNAHAHNVALGSAPGEVHFTDLQDDDLNRVDLNGAGIRVKIHKLDDFSAHFQRIALLKIDVEGYENLVLSGALLTLDKTDCLYFEASEEQYQRYGYGFRDLAGFLSDRGFAIYKARSDGGFEKLSRTYVPLAAHENLYAVKDAEQFFARMSASKSENV